MSVAQYGYDRKEDLSYLGPKRTKIILHRFSLDTGLNNFAKDNFDCYDVISEWTQTEKGKWCCENATELTLHRNMDPVTLTMQHAIIGMLTEKQQTFFTIKFG